MRYNKIRKMDVSNGPGIRVSIFLQGCEFHCKNCFNPETWSFKSGKEFTNETINKILELSDKETVSGLSILGGEPMHPAKKFKEKFPKKTVWVWSGFLYEDVLKRDPEVFNYIDVMVDGQYVDELHDPTLRWKGSSNQRVIDIKKTKKSGKVVLNAD